MVEGGGNRQAPSLSKTKKTRKKNRQDHIMQQFNVKREVGGKFDKALTVHFRRLILIMNTIILS